MVGGLKIVRRQLKGSRKVLKGQGRGIGTIGRRTRKSSRKLRSKTARSTKRILGGIR